MKKLNKNVQNILCEVSYKQKKTLSSLDYWSLKTTGLPLIFEKFCIQNRF